ncbi:MAG TPA: polysaccharide deacetylase [Clostridium sp.]|nr:polysaccharide deacetylase [Clostridium sp.]
MGKKSTGFNIKKILLLSFILLTLSITIFSQVRVIMAVSQNKRLHNKIEEIKVSKETLTKENENLQIEVQNKQKNYEQALSKVKIAYLTFDDGPSNHTKNILDTLDKYGIKATFFVNHKDGMDDLYKEIINRGHVLANHTSSHNYSKVYRTKESFVEDVQKLDNELKRITGKEPSKILRFPGGSNNTISLNYNHGENFMKELAQHMTDLGYTFYDWNVDSMDAATFRQDKNVIVNRVLEDAKYVKHANILMHDLDPKDTTPEALPEIIEGLKAQGFIFESLNHESPKAQFTEVVEKK